MMVKDKLIASLFVSQTNNSAVIVEFEEAEDFERKEEEQ